MGNDLQLRRRLCYLWRPRAKSAARAMLGAAFQNRFCHAGSLALLLIVAVHAAASQHAAPYELVDPFIGTANDGQTYPVVGMPFAMTGWTAETRPTEAKCVSPYYYNDKRITGFRGSHSLSGSCTPDYGTVTLMPTTGELRISSEARASRFRHQTEIATPAYYSVFLDDYSTHVELAGTMRTGMLRVTFPAHADANILIQPYVHPGEGYIEVKPERREVVGYNPVHRFYMKTEDPAEFSGYFAIRFERPFTTFGTWCGGRIHSGKMVQAGGCETLGAFIRFGPLDVGKVLIKVGTSFTSVVEAEKNLDAENPGWDFDRVRRASESAWKHLLGRIEVEGGTPAQQSIFYTALFHASLAPRVVSNADGTYNGFAQQGQLHRIPGGELYYDDFSLWDTFRALHPLLTILDPSREEQMVQSLVLKGEQGRFLPIFPTWNSYTSEMDGDHGAVVIVDAYAKGLRHFDVDAAYALIKKNATVVASEKDYQDGRGRRALQSYLRYGYIPLEDRVSDAFHHDEQVSRTLDYAYDDFAAAQFAHLLHKEADETSLRSRSEDWRHVFDPTIGFVRGRHADGTWSRPFHPEDSYSYLTEGVPWQYSFFVPQNITGLIQAMGGRSQFIQKLDSLFEKKLYDQGNEPSHHIAYLYDYAGAAWKTQQRIRDVMQESFHTGPAGLPGNDDAGQMSAWYVFSAMGFYPVCPGKPEYALGSPVFSKVAIHQPNGKDFTILAPGSSQQNRYIQAATLNGKRYTSYKIAHADIVGGATLKVTLSSKPNSDALKSN